MTNEASVVFNFFDDPLQLYNSMWNSIKGARKYIYIQTYKFGNDPIGQRFRDALTRKAKEGVEVKLLIDSWGTAVDDSFFSALKAAGGQVVFFEKIKIGFDFISRNHRRNHRKITVIDDKITYIGSANLSNHCINWRESILRLENDIAKSFRKIFIEDYTLSQKLYPNKRRYTRSVFAEGFEIIKDIPSTIHQPVRKRFLKLIRSAQKSITIETPYFLPGSRLRKALFDADSRGVEVTIMTPEHSDIALFDILRNKYMGLFHRKNIHIWLYGPQVLHAKLLLVDDDTFVIGSSNFDYRSFRFMHEINLLGYDQNIMQALTRHALDTKSDCTPFNYEKWLKRPRTLKFIEWLLVPVRHFF